MLQLLFIALLALAAWILWIDQSVQAHFDGRRWAVPATVYSRPLQLYAGQTIKQADVIKELELLGYRRAIAVKTKGDFSASNGKVNLYSRGFNFADALEPSSKIALKFSTNRLTSMTSLDGKSQIPLVRLEPLEIAKIYPAHREDRRLISLKDTPPFLIKALIATEDRRFFQHHGIDPRGLARAMWVNLTSGSLRQGASTLTQQLAKNFYLTRERTLKRKFTELFIAFILEFRYDKEQILEAYLNEVFLGQDSRRAIHGFGLAAEYYFNSPINELRPDQLAMLVGMVKGPSVYNPRKHPDRAKARRDVVLKSMAAVSLIESPELKKYLASDLGIQARHSLSRDRYPAFTELVRKQLVNQYKETDLRESGLRIFTTLDPIIQEQAQLSVQKRLTQFEKSKRSEPGKLQSAVIVTDVKSGEIKAMIGARDRQSSSFNRAVNASRHIGSLIKPVVYLAGLEKGKTLATILSDRQINWPLPDGTNWSPENYEKVFYGDVVMINALAHSYNAATVTLGQDIGLKAVANKFTKMGGELEHAYPSMLLGAIEQSPLDVSSLYQSIANDGFAIPPRTIRAVLTQNNEVLNTYSMNVEQVTDQQNAFLLKYAMTEVVRSGTARSIQNVLPHALPLAGKTGTTGDLRDSWFAGFDQNTLTVVWLGRDDNKPAGLTGASGALKIWTDVMRQLALTPLNLRAPAGIQWQWINPLNGAGTDRECAGTIVIPFRAGSAPPQSESCQQEEQKENGFFKRLFE